MEHVTKSFYSSLQNKAYEYHWLSSNELKDEAYVLYVQDGNDYLDLGGFEYGSKLE